MNVLSIIISIIVGIGGIITFFMARNKEAKHKGKQEEQINSKMTELKTEIDTRVKSVCEQNDNNNKVQNLQLEYLSQELHRHIADNEKDHTQFFKMNEDLNEIKGDLKYLIRKSEEK